MGTIAEKLKHRLGRARARRQPTSFSKLRRLVQHVESEIGPAKSPHGFQDYHPNHAVYVAAQNMVSYLAEELSALPELPEYAKIVGQAEDEYMPGGPPLSPLCNSYFTTWAFFDAPFGPDRETIGTCLLDIGPELGLSADYMATIRFMQHSRMGIYEHQGVAGECVRLQELFSGRSYTSLVPAGYLGHAGELWYARVLPPPFADSDDSVVVTTPYCLIAPGKKEWTAFLERTMLKTGLPLNVPALTETGIATGYPALEVLMKYGLSPNYWHEFIFLAYFNHRSNVVFLTGLPDVPESLPHASDDD
jgi:hypothetical protein